MKKILLITNTDMSVQAGNVVLVLRRAVELYNLYGAKTDCVVVNKRHAGKEIRHGTDGISFRNAVNKKELEPLLMSGDYRLVIIYGEKSELLIPYIKRRAGGNVKILLDIQGALEEQTEYTGKGAMLASLMKLRVKQLILRRAAGMSDGFLVVSDELEEYCRRYIPHRNKEAIRFYKIRCGVSTLIPDAERLKWRREIRCKWGVSDDTVVMVFSGSRAPWQKTDEIIERFMRYDRTGCDVFFAFFCNIDDAFKKRLEECFPRGNYVLSYLSFQENLEHLCACDIGFLVRDYNTTNRVAFPNKFSDYINAGLLVALSDALPEPARILKESSLLSVDLDGEAAEVFGVVRQRRENLLAFYGVCNNLCREELLYRTQIEKSGIAELLEL